ncbi:MAG: 16S rRNA (cytosine(967)-C(5))-methyltransferase RsmB [Verrucomicrobiota bacterium]|nr:16S rRNA (cytosine(967)-C(5))-methyltransferase RsmB [Verrucomicrobiota bacterium]
MSVQKPREIAARILARRESENFENQFVENIFEEELSRQTISPQDRALCHELVYGIVRWQKTLDWLIARKTENRPQKPMLQILLHIGLYQMFWLDRIPNHAAVHETVELVKKFGFEPQAGFVNAVLRGYTRERVETEKLLLDLKTNNPALGFSHPDWLVERWQKKFGVENTTQLLQLNNTPPKTFARLNSLKTDSEKLAMQWESEGVKFAARSWDWTGDNLVFQLDSHLPLANLRSFKQGLFYIQDPSTLLAVQELNPHPAQTILDLCAAPGGKTTFIAQLIENRGKIFAQDNRLERLNLIKENCARLGITCIETSLAPKEIIPNPSLRFDRILVDAPCSNTGVMRRRIELRWRISLEEILRLQDLQLQLLRQAAPRLKPGGTLIYSTCSLEPEENSEVIKTFLGEHPNYKLGSERELLPFVEGVDGAYVAKLKS